MHPNPAFRGAQRQENIAFVHDRSFGVLSINGANGPLISHIPVQLSGDGNSLEAHLVRSNPIVKMLATPQAGVIAVAGPDSYISPDWYNMDNQVPTWNYVAVHVRGTVRLLEHNELRGVLERLSQNMEERLAPKPVWKIDKLDEDVFAKMSRQIVPIAMDVDTIDGTWKLGQNKPNAARLAAAKEVADADVGSEVDQLADFMRDADDG